MFEDITRAIQRGSANRQKAVTIHFQILTNADRLRGITGEDFCKRVGIEPTWAIEFKKMMNLADMLKQNGIDVQAP